MDNDLTRGKESLIDELKTLRIRVLALEKLKEAHVNAQQLQSALYRISDIITSTEDMTSFYETLHQIIGSLMDAKNLYIALYHKEYASISFPYYNDDYDDHQTVDDPINNLDKLIHVDDFQGSPTLQVINTGCILHLDRQKQAELVGGLGRNSEDWLGVPLKSDNDVLGALVVQSYELEFSYSRQDEELLNYVSHHIVTALKRKQDSENIRQAHQKLQQANEKLEERAEEISMANIKLEAMLEERRAIQEKLVHDAFHDTLTELPNRALFVNRLEHVLKRAKRSNQIDFAVFFLDLDRFKVINDSLGHLAGDSLLKDVSERLLDCVRPGDTVARLGGDEFCILLDDIGTEKRAIKVANRVLEKFITPFMFNEQELLSSASIGITLSSIGYDNPDDILRDADAAMYQAKALGKACYKIFDRAMHEQAMTRLQLEKDLRDVISEKGLLVCYQPIYELASGKIVAFEALARWKHKDLGFVKPVDFIAIAEEIGCINQLGSHILEQSMTQVNSWRSRIPMAESLEVNVNLSSYQIEHRGLIEIIETCFKRSGLPVENLKLEITESVLLKNIEAAKELLNELTDMKIELVLDDFGTGYSSLGYLQHFPLSALKIDLSFISSIDTNNRNLAIVRTIQALASSLELQVVAEGIETKAQKDIVSNLNIKYGQGYYLGKPMSPEEAEELLFQHNSVIND